MTPFATAAARDSAITAPVDGMLCYITGEDRYYGYDGAAWVRTAWNGTVGRTGFAIRRNANQSVNDGSVDNISFDTEDFDSDGFFAPTGTTVTIPTGMDGLYTLQFSVDAGYPDNSSQALIFIIAGGITHGFGWASRTVRGVLHVGPVPLVATNTITASVSQSSGGASNFTARLWGYRIGR